MQPRILLLSLSVGAGPVRAAEAVQSALLRLAPDALVRCVDMLTLDRAALWRRRIRGNVARAEQNAYKRAYITSLLDQPPEEQRIPLTVRVGMRRRALIQRVETGLLRGSFRSLLGSEPWDLVITTATFCAGQIGELRRRGEWQAPHFRVTTDYVPHRADGFNGDHIFVANEEGADFLGGVVGDPGRVSVTGIPIDPVFDEPKTREHCLNSQELSDERPVVLQMSGGWGMRSAARVYESILSSERPLTVVVVAGHNRELRSVLDGIEVPARHSSRVLGYTEHVDELMRAATIVISKPGGLTVAETLASGTPLAIVNPLLGPESQNCEYLLENGAALRIQHLETIPYRLTQLLDDDQLLTNMAENARRLSKPRAAFDVAQRALDAAREGQSR